MKKAILLLLVITAGLYADEYKGVVKSGGTNLAKSGANADITSMSGLSDNGIPLAKVNGAISASSSDTFTNKTIDADGNGNSITNIENENIKTGAAIDATKIADGSVTSTEFQYLANTTSDIQAQLNAKVTTVKYSNSFTPAGVGAIDMRFNTGIASTGENIMFDMIVQQKSNTASFIYPQYSKFSFVGMIDSNEFLSLRCTRVDSVSDSGNTSAVWDEPISFGYNSTSFYHYIRLGTATSTAVDMTVDIKIINFSSSTDSTITFTGYDAQTGAESDNNPVAYILHTTATTTGTSMSSPLPIGITSTGAGVNITTHTDAGDDVTINTDKVVIEGDTGNIGINRVPGTSQKVFITGGSLDGYTGLQSNAGVAPDSGTVYGITGNAIETGGTASTNCAFYGSASSATNNYSFYGASGDIYNAGNMTIAGTTINMTTSGTTLTVGTGADNGTVSAGVFTDRTKFFDGNAIAEIMKIKGKNGKIDHKSLPAFAYVKANIKVKDKDTGEETIVEEEQRDLGAMISILTKGMQQQQAQIEALKTRIEKLEAK